VYGRHIPGNLVFTQPSSYGVLKLKVNVAALIFHLPSAFTNSISYIPCSHIAWGPLGVPTVKGHRRYHLPLALSAIYSYESVGHMMRHIKERRWLASVEEAPQGLPPLMPPELGCLSFDIVVGRRRTARKGNDVSCVLREQSY